MSCTESNCEEYCGCENISAVCVLYDGVRLTLLDTYQGENLEELFIQIESLFKNIYDKLNGSLYTNIGTGAQVFKKVNYLTQAEFRSITSNSSVDITQNADDINISVNQAWVEALIPNEVTTITNTITGHRIATHTNEDGIATNLNETITTLVDNGNKTFTYTNENGVPVTFDAGATQVITTVTNTLAGKRIATYTNENSVAVNINESLTSLTNNGDNSLTYINENGANFSYTPLTSNTGQKGIVELATDIETQTGTDTTRAITPSALSSRTATQTRTGLIELATAAEANALSDTMRAITPGTIPIASETQRGIVERATQAEVTAGTDTSRYVTPATLQNKLNDFTITQTISQYQEIVVTSWSKYVPQTLSHTLGVVPKLLQLTLRCGSAAYGYAVNEEIEIPYHFHTRPDSPQAFGISLSKTSTNIKFKVAHAFTIPSNITVNDGGASRVDIDGSSDTGNFRIVIRLFA